MLQCYTADIMMLHCRLLQSLCYILILQIIADMQNRAAVCSCSVSLNIIKFSLSFLFCNGMFDSLFQHDIVNQDSGFKLFYVFKSKVEVTIELKHSSIA